MQVIPEDNDKVKIATEPNNDVQTSAETLEDVGKTYINK